MYGHPRPRNDSVEITLQLLAVPLSVGHEDLACATIENREDIIGGFNCGDIDVRFHGEIRFEEVKEDFEGIWSRGESDAAQVRHLSCGQSSSRFGGIEEIVEIHEGEERERQDSIHRA